MAIRALLDRGEMRATQDLLVLKVGKVPWDRRAHRDLLVLKAPLENKDSKDHQAQRVNVAFKV